MSDTKYGVYYNHDSHIVSTWEVRGNKIISSILFGLLGAPINGIRAAIGVNLVSNFGVDYPAKNDKIDVETTITYNIDQERFEYKQTTYHYCPKESGGYRLENRMTINNVYIKGSRGYAGLYGNKDIKDNMID